MAATIYPSTLGYSWGITATETGMSLATYRQNDTTDIFEQKNGQGETVAVVSYNPRSEITMEGEVLAGLTVVAGKEITIANIILPPATTAGLVICRSLEYNDAREAMRRATITATMFPLIPPGS
jgi:hypothetical protein